MINLRLGDTQAIISYAKGFGVLRNQLAYILATARWETAHTMKPVKEAYWKSEAWRKKNLRYYPWYGRGYVQLTWERNYRYAEKVLGARLTDDPDLALRPEIAVPVLVRGSMQGWFTGKKIPDYITLQKSDFHNARRVINGTDKAAEIAKLARQYDAALKKVGYGEGDEPVLPPDVEPTPKGGLIAAIVAALAAIIALIGVKK